MHAYEHASNYERSNFFLRIADDNPDKESIVSNSYAENAY